MKLRLSRNSENELGGHSKTHQRELLLEIIREADGHIDAKELFRRAIEKDISISHATVYRSLNLFKDLGLIDEQRWGHAQCYYEAKRSIEHQHLVCQRCGRVFDFACPMSEMVERVRRERGFVVTKAQVYLEGYCAECSEKEDGTDGN